jgi:hypothetical protein
MSTEPVKLIYSQRILFTVTGQNSLRIGKKQMFVEQEINWKGDSL